LAIRTSFDYDLNWSLWRTTYPDGTADSSAFNAENHRVFSTNRLDFVTQYIYDPLGRLSATIAPDNTTNSAVFDVAGRVAYTVDARGTTNAFGYDLVGRRTSVTNALGTAVQQVTQFGFDSAGNQTNVADALNHSITYFFGALNR